MTAKQCHPLGARWRAMSGGFRSATPVSVNLEADAMVTSMPQSLSLCLSSIAVALPIVMIIATANTARRRQLTERELPPGPHVQHAGLLGPAR